MINAHAIKTFIMINAAAIFRLSAIAAVVGFGFSMVKTYTNVMTAYLLLSAVVLIAAVVFCLAVTRTLAIIATTVIFLYVVFDFIIEVFYFGYPSIMKYYLSHIMFMLGVHWFSLSVGWTYTVKSFQIFLRQDLSSIDCTYFVWLGLCFAWFLTLLLGFSPEFNDDNDCMPEPSLAFCLKLYAIIKKAAGYDDGEQFDDADDDDDDDNSVHPVVPNPHSPAVTRHRRAELAAEELAAAQRHAEGRRVEHDRAFERHAQAEWENNNI